MIPIEQPPVGEEEQAPVAHVLASGQLAQGEFERRFAHMCQVREAIAASSLKGRVQTPIARPEHRHVFHQYTIGVPDRRDICARALWKRGVGTAIHYPCPIHLQPSYRDDHPAVVLPVAETAATEVLSLPVHPFVSPSELETVANEVLALCH